QFNDPGISWMFYQLCSRLADRLDLDRDKWTPDIDVREKEPRAMAVIPGARIRYLSEIAEQGRSLNGELASQAVWASRLQHCFEALKVIEDPRLPKAMDAYPEE